MATMIDVFGTLTFTNNGGDIRLACGSWISIYAGGSFGGGGSSNPLTICGVQEYQSGEGAVPGVAWFGNSPLPIELLYFNASQQGNIVELQWATVWEENNDYFTVERSRDAFTFRELMEVDGAGNSNQTMRYQAIDEFPIPGLSFYRLKQTDFDGLFEYSPVVSVFLESEENSGLEIYPNPTSASSLNLRLNQIEENQKLSLILLDLTGKRIFGKEYIARPNDSYQMTISPNLNLNSGIYIVDIRYGNQIFRQRLIVN